MVMPNLLSLPTPAKLHSPLIISTNAKLIFSSKTAILQDELCKTIANQLCLVYLDS